VSGEPLGNWERAVANHQARRPRLAIGITNSQTTNRITDTTVAADAARWATGRGAAEPSR